MSGNIWKHKFCDERLERGVRCLLMTILSRSQSPHSDSSGSWRSTESPMSVQVDPMAASVVAAALSGTYPTLLPQWCLPPREAPLGVQGHQDNATTDQPLDLSAKPKNSQVQLSYKICLNVLYLVIYL